MKNRPLSSQEKLRIRKILVIQLRPFGDVLLGTSYLKALKDVFVNAHVDFLVSEPFDAVVDKNPNIDTLLVSPKRGGLKYLLGRLNIILRIAASGYDIVIDQQNGVGSRILLLLSRAPIKVGWANGKSRFLYTHTGSHIQPACYSAVFNYAMVKPLGVIPQGLDLFFYIAPTSREYVVNWLKEQGKESQKKIFFSPGSSIFWKAWDPKCYAKLADMITQKYPDYEQIVLWAPKELPAARAMLSAMQEKKALLAPPTTFNQVAALLEKSTALICNDGGLYHLSVATKTPALAIFWANSRFSLVG